MPDHGMTDRFRNKRLHKFYVTEIGKKYQSASWISFTGVEEEKTEETFEWDFLYIPENFE